MRSTKNRLLRVWLFAALVLAALPLQAAESYQIVPRDSIVRFTVTKLMVERVDGNYHDFRGAIHYDPARPETSSVEMSVVVRSVTTGATTRDRTLQNEDFFHSERYPHMTFRSVRVTPRDDGGLEVTRNLTIRGVTRRVTIPVRVTELAGGRVEFETSFVVDRTEFGVNGSRWSGGRNFISHEATIYLKIVGATEDRP